MVIFVLRVAVRVVTLESPVLAAHALSGGFWRVVYNLNDTETLALSIDALMAFLNYLILDPYTYLLQAFLSSTLSTHTTQLSVKQLSYHLKSLSLPSAP